MTWPRSCRATRRDGQPCGNYAITGGYVCRMHGGGAPAVKAKARVRFIVWKAERQAARLTPAELEAMFPVDPQVAAAKRAGLV